MRGVSPGRRCRTPAMNVWRTRNMFQTPLLAPVTCPSKSPSSSSGTTTATIGVHSNSTTMLTVGYNVEIIQDLLPQGRWRLESARLEAKSDPQCDRHLSRSSSDHHHVHVGANILQRDKDLSSAGIGTTDPVTRARRQWDVGASPEALRWSYIWTWRAGWGSKGVTDHEN